MFLRRADFSGKYLEGTCSLLKHHSALLLNSQKWNGGTNFTLCTGKKQFCGETKRKIIPWKENILLVTHTVVHVIEPDNCYMILGTLFLK